MELERTLAGDGAAPDAIDPVSGRIERIDRLMIIERLGHGAMGIVFKAYDPKLDRKVAVKVLRAASGSSKVRSQQLTEARAMARLSHPNVVTVHDVGEIGDYVFISMELLEAGSLRTWMDGHEGTCPPHQALPLLIRAGRGLSAAHRAGLVHRDLKPENVLLGEDFGDSSSRSVKVADFGLAVLDRCSPSESGVVSLDEDQRATTMAGTPAYMAPEVLSGGSATALSDQYSFCVMCYEVLYGRRPFGEESLADLARRADGNVALPGHDRGVPLWLRRCIERGLHPDPNERWVSMDALLDALEKHPRRRRQRLVGLTMVLMAGLTLGAVVTSSREAPGCDAAGAVFDSTWNASRRAEIRQRLTSSDVAFADQMVDTVLRQLDEFSRSWREATREACLATRSGQETAAVLDLRARCLHRARRSFSVLVDRLSEAQLSTAMRAHETVNDLSSPARCTEVEELRELDPLPDDPALRARIEQLQEEVAKFEAEVGLGLARDPVTTSKAMLEEASAIGYRPLIADALLVHAETVDGSGEFERAAGVYEKAYRLGVEAGYDTLAAEAVIGVIGGYQGSRGEDESGVRARLGDADALLRRLESRHSARARRLRIDWYEAAINIERRLENLEDGRRLAREALSLIDAEPSLEDRRPDLLNTLAKVELVDGQAEEAAARLTEAIAQAEVTQGKESPALPELHANLGIAFKTMRQWAEAAEHLEFALARMAVQWGPESDRVANLHQHLGKVYEEEGNCTEALRHYRALHGYWGGPGMTPHTLRSYLKAAQRCGGSEAVERAGASIIEQYPPDQRRAARARVTFTRGALLLETDPIEAERLFRKALPDLESAPQQDRAVGLYRLFLALDSQGRNDEAMVVARAAREEAQTVGLATESLVAALDEVLSSSVAQESSIPLVAK